MKIALLGYGKMGKTIERLVLQKGYEVVFKSTESTEEGKLDQADVAIDFSTPDAAFSNISEAIIKGIPTVSGTTGWLEHLKEVESLVEKCNGSFLYASNFSVGVNLFFYINEYAAKLMAAHTDYEVSIEEIHHTEKKDAPSGTAISLAESILKYSLKKKWELESDGQDVLPISAKREADVKGTHSIYYQSPIDDIILTHQAHSRDGFAKGAILAAEYIANKKGIFTMKDVLALHG